VKTYGKIMPDGQPAGANRNTPEKAVTAFEIWKAGSDYRSVENSVAVGMAKAAFLACAAEAERLCRENTKVCGHLGALCHLMDGNDIRAKLAEVDRLRALQPPGGKAK
jgi:hypothetical protein